MRSRARELRSESTQLILELRHMGEPLGDAHFLGNYISVMRFSLMLHQGERR
jgi:hypothetical protein